MLRTSLLVTGLVAITLALFATGAAGRPTVSAAFPVTITTPSGKVTVAKKPRRIVSLSPTATETLFAIGAGKQVVAVDDQSDYPKSAPKTALSGFTPNVEAIAGYRPDLVVISYDTKGLADALRKLGIKVVHHDGAKSFKGAYQQIRQLGLVTGNEAKALRLVARMKATIGRIVRASRDRAGELSVYHELDSRSLLGDRRRRSWARCTRLSVSATSPTLPRTPSAPGTRSSRPSTSCRRART